MLHTNKPHSKYSRLYSALTQIKPDRAPSVRWHAAGIAHGLCIEMGFPFDQEGRFCKLASTLAGAMQ